MQVKQLKQDGLNHELEVTVGADEIANHVDSRLVELSQTVNIPGFRPGKVPMSLMKKKYGKAVMGEVLETAVNDSSQQAMKDQEIIPALQPKIEVKSFDEGKDLIYTMAIEVLPKIEIKDYKGFKLTKLIAKADDSAIDEALGRIASTRKTSKVIEGKRAAKSGDTLVIDFDGRTADDDVKQPGMAAEGHHLELGSNSFIPGFEDQLIGKKAGDKLEVKVQFPEEYGSAELAGRDAIFDVEIHEIRESVEAEIDDEFAKSLGMDDLKALRDAVAEQTNQEFDNHSRLKLKKELLDQLDESHKFDIPQGMKDLELQNILQQVKMDNQQRGIDVDPTDEETAELTDIAARRVRLGLVLSEIGKENNIQVADAELQKAVITEAQKYPGQEKEVFDYFAKNREALESLRAPIYEDKVVDFILELATVTEKEVTVEELTSDEDADDASKSKTKKKPAAKKKETAKKDDKSANEESSSKSESKKAPAKKKDAPKKKAS
ncbi:MAG: trigger factor [Zetaproteobacteria bacterium]|nr:MAG: trigger factor [Zetaproteobacteria bacterium]